MVFNSVFFHSLSIQKQDLTFESSKKYYFCIILSSLQQHPLPPFPTGNFPFLSFPLSVPLLASLTHLSCNMYFASSKVVARKATQSVYIKNLCKKKAQFYKSCTAQLLTCSQLKLLYTVQDLGVWGFWKVLQYLKVYDILMQMICALITHSNITPPAWQMYVLHLKGGPPGKLFKIVHSFFETLKCLEQG